MVERHHLQALSVQPLGLHFRISGNLYFRRVDLFTHVATPYVRTYGYVTAVNVTLRSHNGVISKKLQFPVFPLVEQTQS